MIHREMLKAVLAGLLFAAPAVVAFYLVSG